MSDAEMILSTEQVESIRKVGKASGGSIRDCISDLADSHETLRAAPEKAEKERDAYRAQAEEADTNFGVAQEERDNVQAEAKWLRALVEGVARAEKARDALVESFNAIEDQRCEIYKAHGDLSPAYMSITPEWRRANRELEREETVFELAIAACVAHVEGEKEGK